MKRAIILYIAILLMLLSPIGCSKKSATTPQQPAAQKAQPAAQPAPSAQQPQEVKVEKEVYEYSPKGKKDPFSSVIELNKEKIAKKKKALSPVETFDIEELKLIAIISDSKQYYAMITLPDNKSYTIRKGMTLGINGGKVREITKDSITISEEVKDYKGQLKTKDTTLKLRKEEEE